MNYYNTILLENDILLKGELIKDRSVTNAVLALEAYGVPMLDACQSLLESRYSYCLEKMNGAMMSQTDMDERNLKMMVKEVRTSKTKLKAMKVISTIMLVLATVDVVDFSLASLISVPLAILTAVGVTKSRTSKDATEDQVIRWIDGKISELDNNISNKKGDVEAQRTLRTKLLESKAKIEKQIGHDKSNI